ncbi:MAG TPA: hypothetical protein VEM13_03375 [Gemmatimonadales bacterium]|nr:hypothetical protein [Gemmatimonadales bacterium]
MIRASWSLALVALAALGGLAAGACGLADVFRPAGLNDVVVTYCGDTLLTVGIREAPIVTVEADGATIPNPRLSFSSSDTTLLGLTPIGDTLVAKKTGGVLLTVRLVSSMVTSTAPADSDSVHVRGGGSAPKACP